MEAIAKRIKEAHPDQDINIKTAEFGQRSIWNLYYKIN
jgi:hypothetical protein